jgi:hypothetical protein
MYDCIVEMRCRMEETKRLPYESVDQQKALEYKAPCSQHTKLIPGGARSPLISLLSSKYFDHG